MSELTKAKRRIKRLETCLRDVLRWISDEGIELNGRGADNDDNAQYVALCRLNRRIRRTIPAGSQL
jgi:hypothetical protein